MKVLVDMNLSPRWVKRLAEAGIEAAHWSALGAKNAPDAQIVAFAKANGYVVLLMPWISVPSWRPRRATSPAWCRSALGMLVQM